MLRTWISLGLVQIPFAACWGPYSLGVSSYRFNTNQEKLVFLHAIVGPSLSWFTKARARLVLMHGRAARLNGTWLPLEVATPD